MKNLYLSCLGLIAALSGHYAVFGQTITYADSVISFSSEYTSTNWSAKQVLDTPNTYPNYGDIPTSWTSQNMDGQREFLELHFSNFLPIDSIWVYETYNCGFTDTVYVKNPGTGLWEVVYSHPVDTISVARILRVGFPMTSFVVTEVRLAINSPDRTGWNEIDAVAVINSVVSSVNNNYNKHTFNIFPNPAGKQVYLDAGDYTGSGIVRVLDLAGREITTAAFNGQRIFPLDLGMLPEGMYFIRVETPGRKDLQKISVQ